MARKEFKSSRYFCSCCGDIIKSSFNGEFVRCRCGKSFVDETYVQIRTGGTPQPIKICDFCDKPCNTEWCITKNPNQ